MHRHHSGRKKKAGIDGEESSLWREMACIIGEIRPRCVFVENSADLVIRGLDRVLADLTIMGYDCKWGVMGGHHLGKTQRKRLWLLGQSQSNGLVSVQVYARAEFESKLRRDTKLVHGGVSSDIRRVPVAGFPGVDHGLSEEMVGAIRGCGMAQIPPVAGIMETVLR